MVEETQEDLSMEDILSSIRNILVEDHAEQQARKSEMPEVEEETSFSPLADETVALPDIDMMDVSSDSETFDATSMPLADDEPLDLEEDDILDLSSSMIIDEEEPTEQVEEVSLQEPEVLTVEPEEIPVEAEEVQEGITTADIDFTASLASLVSDETRPQEPEDLATPNIILDKTEEDFAQEDDTDPTDGAVLAASAQPDLNILLNDAEDNQEQNVEEADVIEMEYAGEEEADPVFVAEEIIRKEFDADKIYEQEPEVSVEEKTLTEEPVVETDTLNEIINLQSQVREETAPIIAEPEVITPEETQTEADAIDVSASIISNFAKMFADKKEEATPQPVIEEAQNTEVSLSMPLGGGNKTLEDIVKDTVSRIIEKNLQSVNLIATQEINRQTQAWLNENLPKLVESVVKKEIERVMVKVGR